MSDPPAAHGTAAGLHVVHTSIEEVDGLFGTKGFPRKTAERKRGSK